MYKFDSIKPILHATRGNINNGTKTNTNLIDTSGFSGGLLIVTVLMSSIATDGVLGTCQLNETDVLTDPSTLIPGCDAVNDLQASGAANEFPVASNEDHSMFTYYVPLGPTRKRYIASIITETGGANVDISVTALLLGESMQSISPAVSSSVDGDAGSMYRATP